jgi:hypothetical protein
LLDITALASSATGDRVAAILGGSRGFSSANGGLNWTSNNLPLSSGWISIASSAADGSKLVAVSGKSLVYSSTDFGATWTSNDAPGLFWQSVASSADGNKLYAVANGASGAIWTRQIASAPVVNLARSNTNLVLSWTWPSSDFVLQRNRGLSATGWTDVTNVPTLNLTNLQNQVTLGLTPSNQFFRLKSQ